MEHTKLSALLPDIHAGQLEVQAEEKLKELIAAIKETRTGGKLTLVLDMKFSPSHNCLMVTGDIKIAKPKVSNLPTIFFATEAGGLSRKDPRQMELEMPKQKISLIRNHKENENGK